MANEKKYFEYTVRDSSIKTIGDFVIGQGTILNGIGVDEFILYNPTQSLTNLDRVISKYDANEQYKYNIRVDYINFPLKFGTVLLIPFEFADRDILRTISTEINQVDFATFLADQLIEVYIDPLSKKTYSFDKKNQGNFTYKNTFQNISVWIWSKALSIELNKRAEIKSELVEDGDIKAVIDVRKYRDQINYSDVIINVTPFISSLNTQSSIDGSSFSMNISPVTGKTSFANLINKKWDIDNNTIKFSDFNKVSQSVFHDNEGKRKQYYFNRVIQENDVIFIRYETLQNEPERINNKEEFFIDKKDIQNKKFDFIGLIDQNNINTSPANGEISIQISGRDLMKLLIEDGVYFYPFDYVAGGMFSNEKDDDRLLRYDGKLQSKFQYSYRKIDTTLKFIFNALSNIEICSSSLFDSYGKKRTSFFKEVENEEKKKVNKLTPVRGIWQIIKLIIDRSVNERIIADGSIGNENGSLINAVRKVCQEPFVQFFGDTYGDQFYFVARKPPFDKESLVSILDGSVINEDGEVQNIASPIYIEIEDSDIENDSLSYGGVAYSWYMLRPQGSLAGGETMSLAFLKAIYFKEYADIFGSKPLDVVTNYIPYYPLLSKDQQVSSSYMIQQGIYDLKYLIESNQYLPFVRKGTITIAGGNRRIKKGTFIKLQSTQEIFYVDDVQNNFSITTDTIIRNTVLSISRGMIEKYIKGVDDAEGNLISYFNICSTQIFDEVFEIQGPGIDLNEEVTSDWKVNRKVFEFFIKQLQFDER